MRLSAFIRPDVESIVEEWESFARKLMPAAEGMSPLALRDHIKNILDFIVTDMESSQTSDEQATKSQGEKRDFGEDSAAETTTG